MGMNLILDPWIPVRCRDGTGRRIAPWEVTATIDTNPVVSVASPRADFDGALVQFLVGVLQTGAPPEDTRAWRTWLRTPPTPDMLRSALAPLAPMFVLDGDGPRFMQEQHLLADEPNGIDALLIDAPGDQTLKTNKDLFVKRARIQGLCPACCASALFTLQTNSPSGGKGHRTSLRGGGPITTLVVGDDLWRTVWMNVLTRGDFEVLGNPDRTRPEDRFPWMGPTRTSEKGEETTPDHAHASQVFWATPRRIRLDTEQTSTGNCDICGAMAPLVRRYFSRPYGFNYKGAWVHPLSPHLINKDTTRLPRHMQPGGIGYRHWLGLVLGDTERNHEPARVVQATRDRQRRAGTPRLWAFGYDVDNMKARGWYEGTMPLFLVDAPLLETFEARVGGLVRVADSMCHTTTTALKRALFGSVKVGAKGKVEWDLPRSLKTDADFFLAVQAHFWSMTEGAFYTTIQGIHQAVESGQSSDPWCEAWLATLRSAGDTVFDQFSQTGRFEAVDARSVAVAWNELRRFNSPRNRKLRDLLMLPSVDGSDAGDTPTMEGSGT